MQKLHGPVRKRCRRCGWTGLARLRQRHCHQRRFGKGSWACWGELERAGVGRPAQQQPEVPLPAGRGIGWYLTEEAMAASYEAKRQQATKDLAHARRKMAEAATRIRRATTSLKMWERRAAHYARRASLTDAEIAAERETRKQKASEAAARRIRRGIRLQKEA